MLNDPLANVLSKIMNNEKIGKSECLVRPSSKMIKKVLEIMNEKRYIGKYEQVTDAKGGVLKINLLGKINSCNVIKPRFDVKKDEFEKYEKKYLPARGFGLIIVSTTHGLMTHEEAKERKIGGKLLAYCY